MTNIDINKYSKRFQKALKGLTPPDPKNTQGQELYDLNFQYIDLLGEGIDNLDDTCTRQISSIEHKAYRIIKSMSGKEMVENNPYIEMFFLIQDHYIKSRYQI